MLATDPATPSVEFPADALLDLPLLQLDPASVLEMCRERLAPDAGAEGQDWQACRMIEALYHPGRYVRAAYALLTDPTCPPERYWPEGRIVYLHAPVRAPISRRGALVEYRGARFEAYQFPEDRRLRGLRRFTGRPQATALWQRWLDDSADAFHIDLESLRRTLIRYVPEQKWVARLRCRGTERSTAQAGKRSIAVRIGAPAATESVRRRHQELSDAARGASAPFAVPRVVGWETGLLAVEWLKGDSLVDALGSGDPAPVIAAATTAVLAFHKCPVADLPPLTPRRVFVRAAHAAHDLKFGRAELGPRLEAVLRGIRARMTVLERSGPAGEVTLHNDLHWNQLRFGGGRVAILDLERMGRGDPSIDAANLVTQLRLLGRRPEAGVNAATADRWAEGFMEAWRRSGETPVETEPFGAFAALSALELARGMMRHLRPGWGALAEHCVRSAEGSLA